MTEAHQRVLLGVTGGIAAYKSAELCRELVRAGAQVQVVMTRAAQAFVGPMTFQALTGRAVRHELLDPSAEQGMGHIELARWADCIVIAPASADTLARLAAGMANDLLTTVVLAARAPLVLAPAMNQAMWSNPATRRNVDQLDTLYQPLWVGPASGDQACGDVGSGRMSEPLDIARAVRSEHSGVPALQALSGRHVVITAGPTREPIDPVRYLTNRSSGKMGFALAGAAAAAGARVDLVTGPVALPTPPGVTRHDVDTARAMAAAVEQLAAGVDLFIGAAAVADYRPAEEMAQKHKKEPATEAAWTLTFIENPDIIAGIARSPDRPSIVVGFAAETQNVLAYAHQKREAKNLDYIVANQVGSGPTGFDSDDNAAVLLGPDALEVTYGQRSKQALAQDLLATICTQQEAQGWG